MGLFYKYYEINTVNCSLADYSKGFSIWYSIWLHPKKKGTTILYSYRSLSTVVSSTENRRFQGLFKAFE